MLRHSDTTGKYRSKSSALRGSQVCDKQARAECTLHRGRQTQHPINKEAARHGTVPIVRGQQEHRYPGACCAALAVGACGVREDGNVVRRGLSGAIGTTPITGGMSVSAGNGACLDRARAACSCNCCRCCCATLSGAQSTPGRVNVVVPGDAGPWRGVSLEGCSASPTSMLMVGNSSEMAASIPSVESAGAPLAGVEAASMASNRSITTSATLCCEVRRTGVCVSGPITRARRPPRCITTRANTANTLGML